MNRDQLLTNVGRIVLIAEWSSETGKVVRVCEYLDTAMTWAVKDLHGA